MKTKVNLPMPAARALRKVGRDISTARRRRRIPVKLLAERAGISRATIGKIEKGDSTVSVGGYAVVLYVLGLTDRLYDLADAGQDEVGLRMEHEHLPQRVRLPKYDDESSD